MSSVDDSATNIKNVKSPPPPANEAPTPSAPAAPATVYGGVSDVMRWWRREDLLKRVSLGLRGIALLFSFVAFVVMACNMHGDDMNFNKYEEFRYVLAVTIMSTVYTGGQVLFHVHELSTGKKLLQPTMTSLIDFSGDQIMAYLLISASSSGASLTNGMRQYFQNTFTESSAAAISMSFLSFLCLALSAFVSGFKLSTQPYI